MEEEAELGEERQHSELMNVPQMHEVREPWLQGEAEGLQIWKQSGGDEEVCRPSHPRLGLEISSDVRLVEVAYWKLTGSSHVVRCKAAMVPRRCHTVFVC